MGCLLASTAFMLCFFFTVKSYMHMYGTKRCGRYSHRGYYDYFLCGTTQLLYACVFLIYVQAFKHFSLVPNQFREPASKIYAIRLGSWILYGCCCFFVLFFLFIRSFQDHIDETESEKSRKLRFQEPLLEG